MILPSDEILREEVKKWKGDLIPGWWGEEDVDFRLERQVNEDLLNLFEQLISKAEKLFKIKVNKF